MRKLNRRHFMQASSTAAMGLAIGAVSCSERSFELIIRNGLVYSGRNDEPLRADVGVKNGRIAAVGDLSAQSAQQTLDALGMAVTPGFIDVHTHTDIDLLVDPRGQSKIQQGVTTEIGGNCGDSVFPIGTPFANDRRQKLQERYQVAIDWDDAAGFLNRLEQQRIGLNYLTLIGHGDLRCAVMGKANRPPTTEEMAKMKSHLAAALEQGAFGLSTGLEYEPSSFATTEELVELCQVVSRTNGIYATHMRNEDVRVEEAVEEALQIARKSGVRLQISHLKVCQKRNWHKLAGLLEKIRRADQEGVDVHADRYPYHAYGTSLKLLFPPWSREGTDAQFVELLQSSATWQRMRAFVRDKVEALGSWDSVLITRVSPKNSDMQGCTVQQIAVDKDIDPYELVRQLLIDSNGDVSMCGFAMSEENTAAVLAFPLTVVGSDGRAISPNGLLGRDNPHPRFYGTFPRYLGHYVREKQILSLSEAIQRVTSLPARIFGLADRGEIAQGKWADLAIFDPQRIIDRATFTDPHQYPDGIEAVIVNGRIAVFRGEHTGCLAGQVLRRS